MRKCFLTLLAFVMFFSLNAMTTTNTAQAEEVQFEVLGKLGGVSHTLSIDSMGDPIFDVAGGLQGSVIFRFAQGVGVGVNFNWTMSNQNLDETQLTYALKVKEPEMLTQHTSFGISLRYCMKNLIDFGFWINYGFGTATNRYENIGNDIVAKAYGLYGNEFSWNMQSVELGLMAAFYYKITSINLDIMVGLQGYADFGRMESDAPELEQARDIFGNDLDENGISTGGFNIVFGVRYDLVW